MSGKNYISDETGKRLMNALPIVESLEGGVNRRTRRRVRTGGTASATVLLSITEYNEDTGSYRANILKSPTDSEVVESGVYVKILADVTNSEAIVNEFFFSSYTSTEEINDETVSIYYIEAPIIY